MRLRSLGEKDSSGIVEVFDGVASWGGICPKLGKGGWSYYEADAVCRHLGKAMDFLSFIHS